MPFFSFSVNEINSSLKKFNIIANKIYFSKNTELWKLLNKLKGSEINSLRYEKRVPVAKISKNILFCLPPSIGLGDAIEYALSIKKIAENKTFENIAVAFTGEYAFLFERYFNIKNNYPYIINKNELIKFDTIFHVTLEINSLVNQKYYRSNIFDEILNYFKIKNIKIKKTYFNKNIKVNKISIFPISNSPIRTMSYKTLNNLIKILIQKYQIEVYLDKRSEISNFVLSNLNTENVSVINPKDKSELFSMIKNIEYGLFMDSGPLHIAKMFKRRGLLLETSVASNILLKNYKLIKGIKNNFSSPFCKAPCGLTDIFNYDSRYGCYDSLSITSEKLKSNKFKNMISRGVKNYYLKNTINPVNCVSALNVQNIHYAISKDLSL